MNRPETIYLYRRKGQGAFASCGLERYAELYGHCLFETKLAYSGDEIAQLHAANQRLEGEVARLRDALLLISKKAAERECAYLSGSADRQFFVELMNIADASSQPEKRSRCCEYAGCCDPAADDTSLCLRHHSPKALRALSTANGEVTE
jgi:hypothetical protein